MKKSFAVAAVYVCLLIVLSGVCYGSYRYSKKNEETRKMEQNFQQERVEEASTKEIKITSDTKYIVEIYNGDTDDSIREERTMPSEFAGMTRQDLENYFDKYMDAVNGLEQNTGLKSVELLSFSKNEIVVRKTYKEDEERSFFLKLENGEVVVYDKTGEILYENTGIKEENLSKEEIEKLKKGYKVENEKVLYSILENFSS